MKNNKYIRKSHRVTPWDYFDNRTPEQDFIRDHYIEHYKRTHKALLASNEADFINSIIPTKCPYCASIKFIRNGYTKNKIQRYKCIKCNRTFTILNNTIFENHKISISEWIEFCLNLLHYTSIASDSKSNKNAITTSRYWMYKLMLILEDYQKDIVLSGDIYLDETYYSVIKEDIQLTEDGKKKRGISRNKICVATAYDKTNVICFVCGVGKPSKRKMLKVFEGHIKEESTLIHDGENSHEVLVKRFKLKEKIYTSSETKGLSDKDNPLYPINHVHALLKSFLHMHSGFNREDFQGYLNFFCFKMNPPEDELIKIENLLILALNEEKTLTYRSFYAKK